MALFEHDYKEFPELYNNEIRDFGLSSPHIQITEDFDATVVKVVDGDTVRLKTSFRDFEFPLRMVGLDAPEMNAGGKFARDWLKAKILNAKVKIIVDRKNRVDKYGRLLGRLIYGGLDVGQEEVNLAIAVPFEQRKEGLIETQAEIFSLKNYGIT